MKIRHLLLSMFFFHNPIVYADDSSYPLNDLSLNITFSKNLKTNLTEKMCQELSRIFTNDKLAPWGFIIASEVNCSSQPDRKSIINHYQLWTLNLSYNTQNLSAKICRPQKNDADAESKCEAEVNINNVPSQALTDTVFLRFLVAMIIDQLPILGKENPSKLNLNNDPNLPSFKENVQKIILTLDPSWQIFQIKIPDENTKNEQSIWLTNSAGRGLQQNTLNTEIQKIIQNIANKQTLKSDNKKPASNLTQKTWRGRFFGGGLWSNGETSYYLPSNIATEAQIDYFYSPFLGLGSSFRYTNTEVKIAAELTKNSSTQEMTLVSNFKNISIGAQYSIEFLTAKFQNSFSLAFTLNNPEFKITNGTSSIKNRIQDYTVKKSILAVGSQYKISYLNETIITTLSLQSSYTIDKNVKAYFLPLAMEIKTSKPFERFFPSKKTYIIAGIKNEYTNFTWTSETTNEGAISFSQFFLYTGIDFIL